MWIKAQLGFRSYKPTRLEKGQMFLISEESGKFAYPQIIKLDRVPANQEEYLQNNGYPIELYIVDPGDPNVDVEHVLATPEQIGWLDEGSHVEDLRDIELKDINKILKEFDSWIWIEVDEIEDEGQDIYYPYEAMEFKGKVTIRFADDWLYEDFMEEDEQYEEEGIDNEIENNEEN